MAIRGTAMLPSTVSKTLLCVDDIFCGEFSGRLYNPFRPREITFCGIVEMIEAMEGLFDDLAFPQAYFDYRTFRTDAPAQKTASNAPKEVQRFMDDHIFETGKGQKTTFIVQVQFRQNATWQGTIQWADQKKTRHFRSTLEMIKLMSDALEACEADGMPPVDWTDENDE